MSVKPYCKTIAGREAEIIQLGKMGFGYKSIRKKLNLAPCQFALTQLLRRNGIAKAIQRGSSPGPHWGTHDLDEGIKAERSYERAIRKAYAKTTEEKRADALAYYYANHDFNKAKQAANSNQRYHKIKHTPWWKAKQFARNQAYRVVEQVKGLRCGWGKREYLGCSYETAAAHITAQLPKEWTWADYGKVWEIDHIRPLSDFNLLDDEQLRAACHYTNLRPLGVEENRRRKRGRYAHRQAA